MLDHRTQRYAVVMVSCVLLVVLGYSFERHQSVPLLTTYFALFALYTYTIIKLSHDERNLRFWIGAAILYRAVLFFSLPSLSDDFYRFLWDGRLIAAGYNPFVEVPSYYLNLPSPVEGLDSTLFEKLNSQHRFSSYPPVCQLVFWLSAELSPSSIFGGVLAMRFILLIFEVGTLWILCRLLLRFNFSQRAVLIYALNPLVVIEITGNLHFEGVMVFFLILSLFLLTLNRTWFSTICFALSVCTKLIPLLFLPVLPRFLGWKKAMIYWLITGVLTLIFFVPLLRTGIVHGFSTSLGYYFQKFEFNASLYYLIRAGGFALAGFNIIQYAGPLLAVAAAMVICYIAFRHSSQREYGVTTKVFSVMMWCLFVYFLSTTILHPWYIITLLSLSIFTSYRFPIVWTGLIFVTYAGYTKEGFDENLWLVAFEYVILFALILYETLWKRKAANS